jgi:hypothetical protein
MTVPESPDTGFADSGVPGAVAGLALSEPICVVCDRPGGDIQRFPSGTLIHRGCAPTRWMEDKRRSDAYMRGVMSWAAMGGDRGR